MIGREAFFGSAWMILAISRAPISRMLVAQTITDGGLYSSVVSAKAACVAVATSKPSRRRASARRLENSTLLSMTRILAGLPGTIMHASPAWWLGQARKAQRVRASVRPDLGPR